MDIVSTDLHDTVNDIEDDLDEDPNHNTKFIASEHVSLTEELLQKHESAWKVNTNDQYKSGHIIHLFLRL